MKSKTYELFNGLELTLGKPLDIHLNVNGKVYLIKTEALTEKDLEPLIEAKLVTMRAHGLSMEDILNQICLTKQVDRGGIENTLSRLHDKFPKEYFSIVLKAASEVFASRHNYKVEDYIHSKNVYFISGADGSIQCGEHPSIQTVYNLALFMSKEEVVEAIELMPEIYNRLFF